MSLAYTTPSRSSTRSRRLVRLDTVNFTLVGLALLLTAIAIFRWRAANAPEPPRNPIGF